MIADMYHPLWTLNKLKLFRSGWQRRSHPYQSDLVTLAPGDIKAEIVENKALA